MNSINLDHQLHLVDVAMGRSPADLVIRNGQWVCVQSGEIIPQTDIAITGQRIAYVGPDASHTIGDSTEVVDAQGNFLCPGLLDGHMHVESGMLTISEFARAVIPHGTTGMFVDPHEIANVFGLRGVHLMVDEAKHQPIHVWLQVPSCVPSAPGFETPGASISLDDVSEALKWEGIIGLGEVMNFPGVTQGDEKIISEILLTRQAGKIISGHYASTDIGLPFHGYAVGGPQDDHEGTRLVDAVMRIRQGMKVMLRYGSAWHDVAEGVRAITELGLDSRNFILCTDDSHSATLVQDGHVNRAVIQAIQNGIRPITAIQMCTINTAEHFGVSRDVGQIAPGRFADILILSNLETFQVEKVLAKGSLIWQNGILLASQPQFIYPEWVTHSIHIPKPIEPSWMSIKVDNEEVVVNVIGIIENQAPTNHLEFNLVTQNGEIQANIKNDLAKHAVVERHHNSGRVQLGLVHGFGFNSSCAVASTVSHDCHQLVIVGTDDADMALAANELVKIGGGQIVVKEGQVIGLVSLPIAGLMSASPAEVVARQAASVLRGFRECGCQLNNPNMQLSLLSLAVIPALRLTDLGLLDTIQFKFIQLVE